MSQVLARTALVDVVETTSSVFLVNYSDFVAMRLDINGYEVRTDGIMFEKLTIE